MCKFTYDELDQQFLDVEFGEPESNVINPVPHVRLLATVGSPTNEADNGASWHSRRGATGYGGPREALARGPPFFPFPKSLDSMGCWGEGHTYIHGFQFGLNSEFQLASYIYNIGQIVSRGMDFATDGAGGRVVPLPF